MPTLLYRIIGLALVPCLVADPVLATAFTHQPFVNLKIDIQASFCGQALQTPDLQELTSFAPKTRSSEIRAIGMEIPRALPIGGSSQQSARTKIDGPGNAAVHEISFDRVNVASQSGDGDVTVTGSAYLNVKDGDATVQSEALTVLSSPLFLSESLRQLYGLSVNPGTPIRLNILKTWHHNSRFKAFTVAIVEINGKQYEIGFLAGVLSDDDIEARGILGQKEIGPRIGVLVRGHRVVYLTVQPINGPSIAKLLYTQRKRKEAFSAMVKVCLMLWHSEVITTDLSLENVIVSEESNEPVIVDSGKVQPLDGNNGRLLRHVIFNFTLYPLANFFREEPESWIDGYAEIVLNIARSRLLSVEQAVFFNELFDVPPDQRGKGPLMEEVLTTLHRKLVGDHQRTVENSITILSSAA